MNGNRQERGMQDGTLADGTAAAKEMGRMAEPTSEMR